MVIKPKIGIPFDVKDVDFGSLYPSIIKFYNIGYATINCSHEECKTNKFAGLPHWICTKHKALESIFIGAIRDLRLLWYKRQSKNTNLTPAQKSWYKCIEQTLKVFMNAAYGVFAQAGGGFPFLAPPASEEIAGIARSIIQATAQHAIDMGIEVLYGDTDSLFIREKDKEKITKLQKWAIDTYKIDLELDKEYRYMCFSTRKKNYIGVQQNGDIDIKGMTGKKSHTPPFFKRIFGDIKLILKNVQKETEIPDAKSKIRKIVLKYYKDIRERKWNNIEDLAFKMTVNKKISQYKVNSQHIKALKQLEEKGYSVESGSVIFFIKSMKGVTALELAKNEDVDVSKYTEFLQSMVNQILDPLQLEFDEIIGYKKLESFLS
jgi:DNA polymerase I